MGLKPFSDDPPSFREAVGGWIAGNTNDGNPDKYKFSVKRRLDFGNVAVVEINYPGCRNHDGNKILVYEDKSILDRGIKAKCLDPHFLKIGNSPVARFEPTETGWIYAISFAKMLIGKSSYEDVSNVESRD